MSYLAFFKCRAHIDLIVYLGGLLEHNPAHVPNTVKNLIFT